MIGIDRELLTISESYPARSELLAIIDAAMVAWPDIADRYVVEFQATPARTNEHLRLARSVASA